MNPLNRSLYQKSVFWFVFFFACALLAFWSSYYSILGQPMSFYVHFHGILMTVWCLMLISQAFLIRAKKYRVDTLLGKASYLVFPIVVLSTIQLIHATIRQDPQVNFGTYYSMALMLNATLVLSIIYGLGMYYHKDRFTHARYMVCTIFPLFTPITDRIIFKFVPGIIDFAPKIQGSPIIPFLAFF